jgi:hypothetical protein
MDDLNELLKKQAQDFVLPPSPSVWLKVEADIVRRERRRRWLLFIFLGIFLSGSIVIYHLFAKQQSLKRDTTHHQTPVIKPESFKETIIATQREKPSAESQPQALSIAKETTRSPRTSPLKIIARTGNNTLVSDATSAVVTARMPDVIVAIKSQQVHALKPAIRSFTGYLREPAASNMVPGLIKKEEKPEVEILNPVGEKRLQQLVKERPSPIAVPYKQIAPQPLAAELSKEQIAESVIVLKPNAVTLLSPGIILFKDNLRTPLIRNVVPGNILKEEDPEVATLNIAANYKPQPLNRASQSPVVIAHQPIKPQKLNELIPVEPLEYIPVARRRVNSAATINIQQGKAMPAASGTRLVQQLPYEVTAASKQAVHPEAAPIPENRAIPANDTLILSNQKAQKWSFALALAPSLNFSKARETGDSQFIEKYRNATSKDLFRVNYSVRISYQVLPYLQVYSGLGVRSLGEQMRSLQQVPHMDSPAISSPGNMGLRSKLIALNNDSTGVIRNKYTYLEVPLGLSWRLVRHKAWSLHLQADIAINRLVKSAGSYYDYRERRYQDLSNERLKSWLFSYGAGISFRYDLTQHAGIELAPYYRAFPSSVYNVPPVSNFAPGPASSYQFQQYIQQAGISISFKYTP